MEHIWKVLNKKIFQATNLGRHSNTAGLKINCGAFYLVDLELGKDVHQVNPSFSPV